MTLHYKNTLRWKGIFLTINHNHVGRRTDQFSCCVHVCERNYWNFVTSMRNFTENKNLNLVSSSIWIVLHCKIQNEMKDGNSFVQSSCSNRYYLINSFARTRPAQKTKASLHTCGASTYAFVLSVRGSTWNLTTEQYRVKRHCLARTWTAQKGKYYLLRAPGMIDIAKLHLAVNTRN